MSHRRAVAQYGAHPEQLLTRAPEAEHVDAAGVGGDHPADGRGCRGPPGRRRKRAPRRRHVAAGRPGSRPRRRSPASRSRRPGRASSSRRRSSTTSPLQGHAPADEAGLAALRHERDARARARPHHRRDLAVIGRAYHRRRVAAEAAGPVGRLGSGDLGIGHHVGVTDDGAQLREESIVEGPLHPASLAGSVPADARNRGRTPPTTRPTAWCARSITSPRAPVWPCCAGEDRRSTRRSPPARCWRSRLRTCAAWAATCSRWCTTAPRHRSPLNASGRAGAGADAERLRAEGATTMPFRHDIRSVPVPGCVDGWLALHERYGRLDLDTVLGPARLAAEQGFAVSGLLAAMLPLVRDVDSTDDFFAPAERRAGERCSRPGVARALAAIVARRSARLLRGRVRPRTARARRG